MIGLSNWFRMRTKFIAYGCAVMLLALATPALAAAEMEDFFGTWVPADQPATCAEVAEWGEGPQITIQKDEFADGLSEKCEDVTMHLQEGRLRVSASCESIEAGYRAVTQEFEMADTDTLTLNERPYKRCREATNAPIQTQQKGSTLAFAWSGDSSSRQAAERQALQYCRGACKIALWFKHSCGALALGDGTGWGAAWGDNYERRALGFCRERTTNCRIAKSMCTRSYLAFAVGE